MCKSHFDAGEACCSFCKTIHYLPNEQCVSNEKLKQSISQNEQLNKSELKLKETIEYFLNESKIMKNNLIDKEIIMQTTLDNYYTNISNVVESRTSMLISNILEISQTLQSLLTWYKSKSRNDFELYSSSSSNKIMTQETLNELEVGFRNEMRNLIPDEDSLKSVQSRLEISFNQLVEKFKPLKELEENSRQSPIDLNVKGDSLDFSYFGKMVFSNDLLARLNGLNNQELASNGLENFKKFL